MNATALCKLVVTSVIIGLFFVACQQPSPIPTSTLAPSPALTPSPTRVPTPMATPTPTPAPSATATLVPTSAPVAQVVVINDPVGDWAYPSGALTEAWLDLAYWPASQPRPVPLAVPLIDLKSIAIRVDGDSLVVKYQVAAPLPRTKDDFPTIAGQRITGFSIWMSIDTVNHLNNPRGAWSEEAWLFNGWSVRPDGRLNEEVTYFLDPSTAPIQPYYFYTAKKGQLLSGGPGYDYLEVAYPLIDLALRTGQIFTFGVFTRAFDSEDRTVSGDFLQEGVFVRPDGRHGLRLGAELVPPPRSRSAQALPVWVDSLPSCGDRQEFFTTSPIPLSDLPRIFPLGGLSPDQAHLFPMPFLSLNPGTTVRADGKKVPMEVSVVAPGEMKVLVIRKAYIYKEGKLEQERYTLWVAPCREVVGRIDWLTSLAPGLMERFQPPYSFGRPGVEEFERFLMKEKVMEGTYLRADDLIGTFGGTTVIIGMEWQLFDYRTPPLVYASPSRWHEGYKHVVCPVDYFTPQVRDALRAKLGGPEGPRMVPPVCGEIAVDKAGTAQGYWFVPGFEAAYEGFANWDKIITLTPDFTGPGILTFSVGTSMQKSGLAPAPGRGYSFLPRHSGQVNRDFKEVTADGQIYCYQELFSPVGNHPGNAGRMKLPSTIILLQLTSPTTLRVERQDADSCGGGPWQFGSTYTDFER